MRKLTTHKVNGLNEAIDILVLDEPGAGGANHVYEIIGAGPRIRIEFQNGPIHERGPNGTSNEALLAVVVDRLEGFQRGPFKCKDNEDALGMIKGGLTCLLKRTTKRVAQGVEGTNVQHTEPVVTVADIGAAVSAVGDEVERGGPLAAAPAKKNLVATLKGKIGLG